MSISGISKAMKEELPETIEGLQEFIRLAENECRRIQARIQAARVIIRRRREGGFDAGRSI